MLAPHPLATPPLYLKEEWDSVLLLCKMESQGFKTESQAGVENHLDTKARGFTNNVLL